MGKDLIYFIVALVIPFLYYRTLSFLNPRMFDKPFLREKTGLKIHHIHYGMILVLLAVFLLIFSGYSRLVIILFGLSIGFMYDEFIPIFIMKSKRKDEMIAYHKSFVPTLVLFLIIVLALIILGIL